MNAFIRIFAIIANVGVLLIRIPYQIAIEEQARADHHMTTWVAIVGAVAIYLAFNIPAISALIALTHGWLWAKKEQSN